MRNVLTALWVRRMSLILAAMALLLPFASLVPASISYPVLNKAVRVALGVNEQDAVP